MSGRRGSPKTELKFLRRQSPPLPQSYSPVYDSLRCYVWWRGMKGAVKRLSGMLLGKVVGQLSNVSTW